MAHPIIVQKPQYVADNENYREEEYILYFHIGHKGNNFILNINT